MGLLTIKQVKITLGLRTSHINKLIEMGELSKPIQMKRRKTILFWSADEIRELVNSQILEDFKKKLQKKIKKS